MVSLKRVYDIQQLMQAFSLRDIQTVSTLVLWAEQCSIRWDELVLYLKLTPLFSQLERINYFLPHQPVHKAREIREFEKKLPKEFRIELRKLRLKNTVYKGFTGD